MLLVHFKIILYIGMLCHPLGQKRNHKKLSAVIKKLLLKLVGRETNGNVTLKVIS